MKVTVRCETMVDRSDVVDYIGRRMKFALSRLRQHVSSLRVRLYDINGPKGGADQRCAVLLKPTQGQPLFVEAVDANWRVAVDLAADRINRSILRTLKARRVSRFASGMVSTTRVA